MSHLELGKLGLTWADSILPQCKAFSSLPRRQAPFLCLSSKAWLSPQGQPSTGGKLMDKCLTLILWIDSSRRYFLTLRRSQWCWAPVAHSDTSLLNAPLMAFSPPLSHSPYSCISAARGHLPNKLHTPKSLSRALLLRKLQLRQK